MRYVIVGGGIAGTTAAEELRKLDENADITIISEEAHRIYSRVLLPHYILGKTDRERVFLKDESWYEDNDIEWLPGVRVEKLDVKNTYVGLSNGRELPYDKLLIATGGSVRLIPDDLRGVSYFRTLDDADHMLQLLREREDGWRAGIYGGGFIACEYVDIFDHFDLPTTIAFRGPHFWSRLLNKETGTLINNHLRENGVEVIPNAEFKKLVGDKRLEGFVTDQGRVDCDVMGVGIGIRPRNRWIENAGIETNLGVVTNEFLETNAPDIYAAGDIAEFKDTTVGRRRNVGNWMNAMSQARTVAKTMHGERTAFELVSSYATNALGLEMIFVGDVNRRAADSIAIRGSASDGGVTQLFVRDERLVGATIVGRNTDRMPVTKMIKSKNTVTDAVESWKNTNTEISL
jgi:NAD(P)H-nitrite reductase large subunit